ncbi:MAG: hypothetical protein ACREDR_39535, partial [Blastocatellia bacterium]
FKQAIDRGSKNYLVHYYYAEALEREALGSGPGVLGADIARTVIAELKNAISLGPAFARSYYMLAEAYLMTGEHFHEGIQAIRTAIQLEPQTKSFPLALAQLKIRLGEYEEARKILVPLAADSEAPIREPASSLIQQIDNYLSDNRRSDSALARSEQPSDSKGESRRPALIRREKPAPQGSDASAPKTNEPASVTGAVTGDTAVLVDAGRPSLKIDGAEIFEGTLVSIECGRGIVLVGEKDGKPSRFSVSEPSKLRFLGHDPAQRPSFGCGPIKLRAFIYYRPAPGGHKELAGEAVAVELPKQP